MGVSQIPTSTTTASTWTQLATSSPTSGSTVSFTSISAYSNLLVSWEDLVGNAAGTGIFIRFNNDSGSNYSWIYTTSSGSVTASSNSTYISLATLWQGAALSSGYMLINGANDIYKTITYSSQGDLASYMIARSGDAQWFNSATINRIDCILDSATFTSGTIKLYGKN